AFARRADHSGNETSARPLADRGHPKLARQLPRPAEEVCRGRTVSPGRIYGTVQGDRFSPTVCGRESRPGYRVLREVGQTGAGRGVEEETASREEVGSVLFVTSSSATGRGRIGPRGRENRAPMSSRRPPPAASSASRDAPSAAAPSAPSSAPGDIAT